MSKTIRGFRHEFLAEVRTDEASGVEGAGRVDDGEGGAGRVDDGEGGAVTKSIGEGGMRGERQLWKGKRDGR